MRKLECSANYERVKGRKEVMKEGEGEYQIVKFLNEVKTIYWNIRGSNDPYKQADRLLA